MKRQKPITRTGNSLAAGILFANARAYIEDILTMIGEYNEIRDGLEELGYIGTSEEPETSIPWLELVGNVGGNVMVNSAEVLDPYWESGPLAKSGPIQIRRMPMAAERNRLGKANGWTCAYCGEAGTEQFGPDQRLWHVDHSYPVARGGDNQKDNLVLACATCNLQKHAMSALEHFHRKAIPGDTEEAETA